MASITIRTERGTKYRQLNWSENGVQQRRSLGRLDEVTPEAARIALNAKRLELDTGRPVFITSPVIEDHARDYLTWHAGEYPDSHFRIKGIIEQHILTSRHFAGKRLSAITTKDVDLWKAERRPLIGSNTAVKEFKTLLALFNRAIAWSSLAAGANPCGKATRPKSKTSKPPVWYSTEQLQIIYRAPLHGEQWRFAANTGIRRMELLNLEPGAIDERRRELKIVSQEDDDDEDGGGGRTKSGLHRVIPLSDSAIAAFHACMKGRENASRVVASITPPSFSRAFKTDAKRAGLPGSLHSLRHSYAAHMLIGGVTLRELRDLMGHADIETTMIYAHVCERRVHDAAVRISI
jgi:integrase